MQTGDQLDPVALGHNAIDVKGLLLEYGYVMPQGSIAKLPQLPGEVQAAITAIEALREQYETLDDPRPFICQHCDAHNHGMWRKEVSSGTEFLACGECHRVVEVR
jgi:hypothetical protein